MLGLATALRMQATDSQAVILETLMTIALASAVPGLLLRIEAGSAYYFINVGAWVAMVFMIGYLIGPGLSALNRPVATSLTAAVIAIAALLSNPQLRISSATLVSLFDRLQTSDGQQSTQAPSPGAASKRVFAMLFDPWNKIRINVANRAQRSVGGQLRRALIDAGLPASHCNIVFVPPGNTAFWSNHEICTGRPFFVPGTVSAPMVDGLPPDEATCPIDRNTGYGYASYSDASRSKVISDAELCEKVRHIGFAEVTIVETPGQIRSLDCRPSETCEGP